MSSSPDPGATHPGQSSDDTAQFPSVRPDPGAGSSSAGSSRAGGSRERQAGMGAAPLWPAPPARRHEAPAAGDDATMPGVAGYGMSPVKDEAPTDAFSAPRHASGAPDPRMPTEGMPGGQAGWPGAFPPEAGGYPGAHGSPPGQHGFPQGPHGAPFGAPGPGMPPAGPPPGGGPFGVGVFGERAPGVPEKKKRAWLMPAAAGGAVVGLLLALAGGTMAFAGEVPGGTTVLGVDIGGRSQAEAAQALKAGLRQRIKAPVPVKIGDAKESVKPAEIGLAVNYQATATRAADPWPNPITVLFGEREIEPVVTVDAAKLDGKLQKLAVAATEKLTRPAIRYDGLTPKPTYPGSGRGLDAEESARAIRAGWLRGARITIPIVEIKAVTSKADVDKLLDDLARPAVAAPVTVATDKGDVEIAPKAIAKSLIMESDEKGEIIPKVDAKKLRAAAKKEFGKVETLAKDASIDVKGGKLVTTKESVGRELDMKKLTKALLPVLREPAPRKVSGELADTKPKLTSEKIGKLGIKEKISSFTTYFQGGQDRNKNILVIADEVDGALVMPGKTFSLNGYTGERSYAQGYVDAPVIIGGKIKNHVGGGISQFATTIFNAYYYAGMVDAFHRPHGYYISRYPSVVEATVFYPSLDLRFKNDSKYGVLINTSYTNTSITVSMWSTKRYEIKTKWGKKYDHTKPKTVHLKEKDCIPTEGIPGFAQEAWRIFRQNGTELKRERFFWRYKAEPKFVCDDPDPSPGPG
ncbi:MAG: vanomycin resistance protein VanB [Micromonosporaceae bacterium]|nr:vanomycin resistance protein VanB [Micromonosporaceae bacterium]